MPPKTVKRGRGRPKGTAKRETIIALKGLPEFKTWLSEFSSHCGLTQADTVGQALIVYASDRGFRPPPTR
jgi:hypothetical protein